ncbi:MAG: o-succinylbenzoate synthase [Acidobacteria bacterium]|nr:MAG: o-succinylbenzoate synthase [Acidobacteriota bacterium]
MSAPPRHRTWNLATAALFTVIWRSPMAESPNTPTLASIRLHWVRVALHEPFRISSGEVSIKDSLLVELEGSGAGRGRTTGWGEASPMPGDFYSPETPETTWDFLVHRLAPSFLERPELDPRQCSARLAEFAGEPFAKAGLEGAVWDLAAKASAQPLWALLGGRKRALASGAAIGLMPTLDDLLERVERFLAEGYRRIKIKIAPGRDVELVRGVRRRFGDIPLMVDANAAYRLEDGCVFEELDELGLMMIEQPLEREALAEHAELQRRLRTPLCLDESADSLESIREIIRLGSGRILNIKVPSSRPGAGSGHPMLVGDYAGTGHCLCARLASRHARELHAPFRRRSFVAMVRR